MISKYSNSPTISKCSKETQMRSIARAEKHRRPGSSMLTIRRPGWSLRLSTFGGAWGHDLRRISNYQWYCVDGKKRKRLYSSHAHDIPITYPLRCPLMSIDVHGPYQLYSHDLIYPYPLHSQWWTHVPCEVKPELLEELDIRFLPKVQLVVQCLATVNAEEWLRMVQDGWWWLIMVHAG